MHRWRLAAGLLAVVALSGCGADEPGGSEQVAEDTPRLGAPAPTPSTPPDQPMDDLEQPVADRLAPRLAREGLTLQHVACPPWTGSVPITLECKGYVDGVVADVDVALTDGVGDRVDFDAELGEGVVATGRLVARLEAEGYADVDCGPTPAYPARLGMRLVCRVHDEAETTYVVATVTDRSGAVKIEDY